MLFVENTAFVAGGHAAKWCRQTGRKQVPFLSTHREHCAFHKSPGDLEFSRNSGVCHFPMTS